MRTKPLYCEFLEDDCYNGACKKGLCVEQLAAEREQKKLREEQEQKAQVLAMDIGRELIHQAIKSKGLDSSDWPAYRVTEAARKLLDQQGDNGSIIEAARNRIRLEEP
jgi:hypothetical protein